MLIYVHWVLLPQLWTDPFPIGDVRISSNIIHSIIITFVLYFVFTVLIFFILNANSVEPDQTPPSRLLSRLIANVPFYWTRGKSGLISNGYFLR